MDQSSSKLTTRVHCAGKVRPQFATPFSLPHYLVSSRDIPDEVAKLSKTGPTFDDFGLPNFLGEGPKSFGPNFINIGYHQTQTSVKTWQRSNERSRSVGAEKNK